MRIQKPVYILYIMSTENFTLLDLLSFMCMCMLFVWKTQLLIHLIGLTFWGKNSLYLNEGKSFA